MHSDRPRVVDMAPISACLWRNSKYSFTALLNYGANRLLQVATPTHYVMKLLVYRLPLTA